MHILYVSNTYGLYGANQSLLDMALAMQAKGHKVFALVQNHKDFVRRADSLGITCIIEPYKLCARQSPDDKSKLWDFFFNLFLIRKLKKIVKKYQIDIIHSNASNVDFGAWIALFCKIPHVWHIREMLYDDYHLLYDYPRIIKFLQKRADKVICISNYVSQRRRIEGRNVTVIHDGLKIERYRDDNKIPALKEGVPIKLLFSGVIMESKGIMDAVRVVEKLKYQYDREVILKIAGGVTDYLPEVIKSVRDLKIEESVSFVGYQKDLRELRSWADIALMCSRSEALGRITIESMLAGLVVIGADAGATREILEDRVTGYLYQAGDTEQLAEKIMHVYTYPDEGKAVAKAGQIYASEHYDSTAYAEKILEVYHEVKGNRHR